MKSKIMLIFSVLLTASFSSLFAQQPDPLGDSFFPPELIMGNQNAIGLNENQRAYIMAQIQEAQETFTKLSWALQQEIETMVKLSNQGIVDEKKMLEQLDKLLELEAQIKKKQITLMVRIKNKLTLEQQAKLKIVKAQFNK